jgi:malate synthase
MADFEDATAPTWDTLIAGQINLRDAVRRTITFQDPRRNKSYALNSNPAVLMVRPRGLHLVESHMLVDGLPVPASLFDFGLYFFHNAEELVARGSGPYFYLPKLQGSREARLWNSVFVCAQEAIGMPVGTIKATVLLETLPAAFEMDEILYELREHSAGLNCGRWDYIFSFIKTTRAHARFVLPDRADIGMTQPFMAAYTRRVVTLCHRRGVHAMGGMAAQIPIKGDPEANEAALEKVRVDKQREVLGGHDGTWVAHPGLVPIAKGIFDEHMPTANQIHVQRSDAPVTEADLLRLPEGGRITEAGLRTNLRVGIQYLEAWLRGIGCVPLDHLMEDTATAEISRTQVWQWLRHGAQLDDGTPVTTDLVHALMDEELLRVRARIGAVEFADGRWTQARSLFLQLVTDPHLTEFLTLPAYRMLITSTLRDC